MKHARRILSLLMALSILFSTASAFDTSRDSGLLKLVNKSHTLSENYVPALTELSGLPSLGNGLLLRSEAATALQTMLTAMAAEGIPACNVISCYRSYAYQLQLVNEKVEKRVANGQNRQTAYDQVTMSTAPAGASEHQMGLAIDFSAGTATSVSFANTSVGAWLKENAWKYGFILRYQEAKIPFTAIVSEPWHYRYVGVPHAQILFENGWCFEEYISYLHENGSYSVTLDDETYDIFWTQDTSVEYSNILDISSDNDGGWIITTGTVADPLSGVRGHWSESSFAALMERGVSFHRRIDPQRAITRGEFADLCGLNYPDDPGAPLTRQEAARLLEPVLTDKTLSYLLYADLDAISIRAFQSVQMCVSNGIFSHAEDLSFRPADQMTWGEAATTALRYLNTLPCADSETEADSSETGESEGTEESRTEAPDAESGNAGE